MRFTGDAMEALAYVVSSVFLFSRFTADVVLGSFETYTSAEGEAFSM